MRLLYSVLTTLFKLQECGEITLAWTNVDGQPIFFAPTHNLSIALTMTDLNLY